ncbi:cell division protein ZipA C-terminal FtsZ-binding domain-containing protein [Mycoavidus sp. SF9855]|uniref:cell division protein ZipA C-terminal FtsZ-binding domain-containing protein n=1 Tax=Mycoavidus sp. SF9855 TaxID=2968475 RepID=UPI00211BEB7E|nr:cell division protein ZipA C-terminal FtsZ-binding domain-containing protein [Mycoavidus sp. SF9855]UUM22287.1 cell division protein FtsZ [Mycoavidus sp. SF9855]
MDELQFALISAGISVLLSVITYNAWQRIKIRRALPRSLPTELKPKEQVEELSDELALLNSAQTSLQPQADNTQYDEVANGATLSIPSAAHPLAEPTNDLPLTNDPRLVSIIDRRIDCIVPLHLSAPIAAEKLMPLAQRLRRAGNKPIFIEGKPSDNSANWQSLQPGGRYQALRIAVQLANRSGPLNELEFSEFITGAQTLAEALDAELDCPDMAATVAIARELDAFAAQCDVQLSINATSDGAPWSAQYIQAIATQDGLLLSRDGMRFIKLDAKQNPVFVLQFNNINFLRDDLTYKGGQNITLLLDVPAADEEVLPFRLMCHYASSLSQRIGAHLTDDRQRALSTAELAAIEQQLITLYAKLEKVGMPAGSPLARRLFM